MITNRCNRTHFSSYMEEFSDWLRQIGPVLRRSLGGVFFTRQDDTENSHLMALERLWSHHYGVIDFTYGPGRECDYDEDNPDADDDLNLGELTCYPRTAYKVTFL